MIPQPPRPLWFLLFPDISPWGLRNNLVNVNRYFNIILHRNVSGSKHTNKKSYVNLTQCMLTSNYPCICNVHILYTLYVKWQNWYSFSIDIHIFFILMKIIWIDASFHVFLDLHCILSFFWLFISVQTLSVSQNMSIKVSDNDHHLIIIKFY